MAVHDTSSVGIKFTETMTGFISTKVLDDYAKAEAQGRRDGSRCEFTVEVRADDVDRLVKEPEHEAHISGTLTAPVLSSMPLTVRDGRFHLFVVAPDRTLTRRMIYRMPLESDDGRHLYFEGFKEIHDDWGPDLWKDTTTLFSTISEGSGPGGNVVAHGILVIKVRDFLHQLTTVQAVGASNEFERLRAIRVFGQYFAGVLTEIYGGIFAPSITFNPDLPPRRRRPLRLPDPEVHSFTTGDDVRLKLTRYRGGDKGPVILSPGFGTSGLAYTIDTTDQNLPEFLVAHGYDVWIFDYRASPDLPSARTGFNLDSIATYDYPAAVAEVRRATGAESIQVMAHCVGSLTFQMALAKGLDGIRSAICSALTLHPVPPLLNELKSRLYLANFLYTAGVDTLTTDFDTHSGAMDKLFDDMLRLYPTKERCNSPVCRRILFLYGEVYDHNQLNSATHDAIHEMFGVANMTTFKHISQILRAGHAVAADGSDAYLPHADRLALPIAFLHGENNHLFLPEGSKKTYDFLRQANGDKYYVRHVVPNYAHMDCFIGKNAARDVYPIVLAELDKHNP
jgi:cholesterol oxidase